MFLQSPIYPLIITVFTLLMVIIQSIQSEKLLRRRFSLSFINIAVALIIVFIFNTKIKGRPNYEEIYGYYTIFVYVIFLFVFISSFKTSTHKANQYQLFVKSIKESKWNAYYVVDRKERIRDMSDSLLEELNLEKEAVIGKKLFSVLNKTIRITRLDDNETSNKGVENYYSTYKKEVKIGDSKKEEIVLLNHEGKQVILNLIMQPVFVLGKYHGRIVVGEKKTDFDLLGVERKLSQSNIELESIQHRFIATLEISKEGLFYIDLDDRTVWASDTLVNMLGLPLNQMDLNDFRKLIYQDDLPVYLSNIGELSLTKPQYYLKYRIFINGAYLWVEERGKRIFDDQYKSIIMGTLNLIPTKHHQASNIEVLDNLGDYNELAVKMYQLLEKGNYFYTLLIELRNIPKINENHGWAVGNMLMAEYLNKMQSSFVTENGAMFRITGLKYAILITDPRKMDVIVKGIRSMENFLNLKMQYGSIVAELEVYAGISISNEDGYKEEHLYQAAEEALKFAKNPQYNNQVVLYKDLVNND